MTTFIQPSLTTPSVYRRTSPPLVFSPVSMILKRIAIAIRDHFLGWSTMNLGLQMLDPEFIIGVENLDVASLSLYSRALEGILRE